MCAVLDLNPGDRERREVGSHPALRGSEMAPRDDAPTQAKKRTRSSAGEEFSEGRGERTQHGQRWERWDRCEGPQAVP